MRYPIAIVLALGACRSGPTTVRYAGPPVAQCQAGRPYVAPPESAPTTPFVPLAAAKPSAAPGAEPETAEPAAPAEEPVADKPTKPKKPKKPKKQKKASEP